MKFQVQRVISIGNIHTGVSLVIEELDSFAESVLNVYSINDNSLMFSMIIESFEHLDCTAKSKNDFNPYKIKKRVNFWSNTRPR